MRNYVLLALFSLFCSLGMTQDDGMRPNREKMKERLEAQHTAFLTTKLELTQDEAAKFWPVYNEFSKKRQELRKEKMNQRNSEDFDMDEQFKTEEKELALKKSYYEKFKAILPAKKLAKLDEAEQEFKQEVLRKIKERKENRGNRPMR
ncbi:MAG TPA: hypothetical protein PK006_00175 [Saprospiraceae bacterium]|nr:hypothetical protein [Saprospiraceae bacterium]